MSQEDAQLLEGHRRHGNKWTLIAQEIGGRTDNAVKNRFAALEKKRKGTEEPYERSVAPRLDDLGGPRVMYKDQPGYREGDMSWLEQAGLQQLEPQHGCTKSPLDSKAGALWVFV